MGSRAVADRLMYAQDTQPADTRDGVVWVDTSDPNNPMFTYSVDEGGWVPATPEIGFFVTQEAISFTETGVVTTHDKTGISNGEVTMDDTKDGTFVTENVTDVTGSDSWSKGLIIQPNVDLDGIRCVANSANSGASRVDLHNHDTGDLVGRKTADSPYGGGTHKFVEPLTAGVNYRLTYAGGGSSWTYTKGDIIGWTPDTSADIDVIEGHDSTGDPWVWDKITALHAVTSAQCTLGFDTIPDELSAWDMAQWQFDVLDGSLTFDVETNDGSGWVTYSSNVRPPYDISDVGPTLDVRLVANYSKPGVNAASPVITYNARRGER